MSDDIFLPIDALKPESFCLVGLDDYSCLSLNSVLIKTEDIKRLTPDEIMKVPANPLFFNFSDAEIFFDDLNIPVVAETDTLIAFDDLISGVYSIVDPLQYGIYTSLNLRVTRASDIDELVDEQDATLEKINYDLNSGPRLYTRFNSLTHDGVVLIERKTLRQKFVEVFSEKDAVIIEEENHRSHEDQTFEELLKVCIDYECFSYGAHDFSFAPEQIDKWLEENNVHTRKEL